MFDSSCSSSYHISTLQFTYCRFVISFSQEIGLSVTVINIHFCKFSEFRGYLSKIESSKDRRVTPASPGFFQSHWHAITSPSLGFSHRCWSLIFHSPPPISLISSFRSLSSICLISRLSACLRSLYCPLSLTPFRRLHPLLPEAAKLPSGRCCFGGW